jgi:Mor family transcriptional regulator
MPDDKSKTKEDRKLASAQETYEVAALARKYGISESEATTVIKRYGPSRRKLDTHMASLKA